MDLLIIKKLSARAFGKLKNINIEFTSGMNVVYGPNESGKSTVQTFIKGMFYGLNKKVKKDEISEYDKYHPWDGTEFAGVIDYEEEGFFYRVGRNFLTNKVSVCNEFWDDITDQFPVDKKKGCQFAEKHIGMSEKCFEQTMFIRQLETKFKDDTKEIIDRLINLQETGQEDISLKKTVDVLENSIKEIGNERTLKKPLNTIDTQIDQLKKEKNEVLILRNEVLTIEEEIRQKEEEKQEIQDKIEHYKDIKQVIKKDSLLDLYNKAKDYESKMEDLENEINRLKTFDEFPVHLEDRFKELLLEIRNSETVLKNKHSQIEEIENKIELYTNYDTKKDSNNDDLYSVLAEYEIFRQLRQELRDNEDKFHALIEDESGFLNTKSILEILEKLVELKNKSSNINLNIKNNGKEISYSLNDLDRILYEYRELQQLKEQVSIVESNIQKLNNDIKNSVVSVEHLNSYGKLQNVDETLKKKETNTYSLNEVLGVNKKSKNNKIFALIVLLLFGLGILGFGLLNTSVGPVSYTMISLGFAISIISGLLITHNHYISKVRIDINKEANQPKELVKMYEIVGAGNFEEFIKGWNKYKDYKTSYENLQKKVEDEQRNLEQLNGKISDIYNRISDTLSKFNIYHSSDINSSHILLLTQSFNELAVGTSNINIIDIQEQKKELLDELENFIGCDDVDYVLEILAAQALNISPEDIIKKVSIKKFGYVEDDNIKQYNIKQSKDTVEKLNQKISNSLKSIKDIMDKYQIYSESEINDDHINILKDRFNDLQKTENEIFGLQTLRDSTIEEKAKVESTLDILQKEKNEYLEIALVSTDEEFFEGCKKSNELKELLTEKSRLKNIYEELLKGENSETILQKISSINNAKNIDTANIEIDQVETNIDELKEYFKQLGEKILQLKNQVDAKLYGKKELNKIEEEIDWLTNEKELLQSKRNSLETALEVLKESGRELQKDFSPKFQREISQIINRITGGKYTQARPNANLNINVIDPQTGQAVDVEKLSSGTIEQFYLSLRIALANILGEGKENLPLIIDEAFVQYDDYRVRNVLEFLFELSNERQIIIFTCQNRELDILKEIGLIKKVNIINL